MNEYLVLQKQYYEKLIEDLNNNINLLDNSYRSLTNLKVLVNNVVMIDNLPFNNSYLMGIVQRVNNEKKMATSLLLTAKKDYAKLLEMMSGLGA